MTKKRSLSSKSPHRELDFIPNLNLQKIGIVARDYNLVFPNGYRDFSFALPSILNILDKEGCDSVLFSLFSIAPRKGYSPKKYIKNLKNIKTVFLEEFQDGKIREAGRYVIYYRSTSGWKEYEFSQVFGTLTGLRKADVADFERKKGQNIEEIFMQDFVRTELPKRVLGNCCVLLCGETNGVKYSRSDQKIHDTFELRKSIPKDVNVILNPIHDRMTRFEMKLKRKFLSENHRYVISVWNKGKQDKNGNVRDGSSPAWTVYYDQKEIEIERMKHSVEGVEIGILDTKKA